MTEDVSWVAFVAPGRRTLGWLRAALMPEHIIDVRESVILTGESAMMLVNADVLSAIDDPVPPFDESTPAPTQWPDGKPVTPWADPWHDVLADIRKTMEGPPTGNPLLDDYAEQMRQRWVPKREDDDS